jgi:hypothetical protein
MEIRDILDGLLLQAYRRLAEKSVGQLVPQPGN